MSCCSYLVAIGSRHDFYRTLAMEQDLIERDRQFSEHLALSMTKLHALTLAASTGQPEVTMDYRLETSSYAARSGKRMFVPLTRGSPLRRSLPVNDRRSLDLYLPDAYSRCDTMVVHFPPGYAVENAPMDKKIESEFGSHALQVEKKDDQLRIIRRAEILPVSVPAARYGEVRQFYLEATKADGAQAVLVKRD